MSGSADDRKLNVDEATVPPGIPVDILPLSCANWPDNQLLLKGPSWGGGGDQERMSGPTKFELISYFLQNIFKLKIKFNLKIRENL
jgi:hypothetical protein